MEKKKSINPFTANLHIKTFRSYSKRDLSDKADWKDEDGVVMPVVGMSAEVYQQTNSFLMEIDQSTRLYKNDEIGDILSGISDRAAKMLIYIMQKLPKDSEVVEVVPSEYMEIYKMQSIQTVYNSLRDLMEAKCIARYKPNKYWINPAIFFNGNRIKKYPDKVSVEFEKNVPKK